MSGTISIRLAVEDQDSLRAALEGLGTQGAAAMNSIGDAAERVGSRVSNALSGAGGGGLDAAGVSADKASTAFNKLLLQLDPLERASVQFSAAQRTINAALDAQAISAEEAGGALALAQKRYDDVATSTARAAAASQDVAAAQVNVTDTAGKASDAHGKLSFATAGTTREFIVLGHEVISGNFSRIPGSLLVLAERSGGLTDAIGSIGSALTSTAGMFGILGVAAVAGLGVAAYAAESNLTRLSDLREGLRLTHTDYAALATEVDQSARQVAATSALTRSAAQDIAKTIASSINFRGSAADLAELTKAADDYARVAGVDGVAAGKLFRQAIDDPAAAAKALAQEGLPAMNVALQHTIDNLAASGHAAEATALTLGAIRTGTKGAADDLPPLALALHHLSEAFTSSGADGKSWATLVGEAVNNAATNGIDGITRLVNKLSDARSWITKNLPTISQDGGASIRNDLAAAGGTGNIIPGTEVPALSSVSPSIQAFIQASAQQNSVDAELLSRLQLAENRAPQADGSWAGSGTGATGPMQVTGTTFRGLQAQGAVPQGANINDPATNISAGATLFGRLLRKYGDPQVAVLAYHDGEGIVDDYLAGRGDRTSQEGWNEAGTVTKGYAGSGLAGSMSRNMVSATAADQAVGGLVLPDVTVTARQDPASVRQALSGNDGTLSAHQQDLDNQIGLYVKALGDLAAQGTTSGESVDRLNEKLAKVRGEFTNAISPAQALVRGYQDQAGAAQALTAGDQKLAEVRQRLDDLDRANPGSVTPELRAQAYAEALNLQTAAFDKQIATITATADASNMLSASYDKGSEAVLAQAAATKGADDAAKLFGSNTPILQAATDALTDAYRKQATAAAEVKIAQQNASSRDNLDYIQAEIASVGMDTDARTKNLAVLKATQEMHRQFGDVLPREAQDYIALAGRTADATAAYQHQQQVLSDVTGAMSGLADTIGNDITQAFTSGQGAAVTFTNILKAVETQVGTLLTKMALINPILNALDGGHRTTISDVSGLLGGLFGSSGGTGSSGAIPSTAAGVASLEATGFTPLSGLSTQQLADANNASGDASVGSAASGGGAASVLGAAKGVFDLGKSLFGSGASSIGTSIGTSIATAAGATAEQIATTTTNVALSNAGAIGGQAVYGVATTAQLGAVSGSQIAIASVAEQAGASAASAASAATSVANAIPYIGVAISVVSDLISGNFRGAAFIATGAALGAAIGSVIPVLGTAAGAAVGAVIGGLADTFFPQHPKNPYLDVQLDAQGGQLSLGKVTHQLEDPTAATSAVDTFATGLNTFMGDVGLKLANLDGKIGSVGDMFKNTAQAGVSSPLDLFNRLRFTDSTNDGSNFAIAKAGALPGQEFQNVGELQAQLVQIANLADRMDSLGIHLASVGDKLTNIAVASVSTNVPGSDALQVNPDGSPSANSNFRTALSNDLPRQNYADAKALDTEIQKVNQFVNGTLPSLIDPVFTVSTPLQTQIYDLVKTYKDATREAASYGLATDGLTEAMGKAIAKLQDPAIQDLALSNLGIVQRGQTARGESTVDTQLQEFDINAAKQRQALQDSYLNIYGSLTVVQEQYGAAAKTLDQTLAAERLTTQAQLGAALVQAEQQAAAARVQAVRAAYDAQDSVNSAFESIRARQATLNGDPGTAALITFDDKAAQEQKTYARQLVDFFGDSFYLSQDYQSRMTELETVQQGERLAIVQQYGGQITGVVQATAAQIASAQGNVGNVITSLSSYAQSLQTGASSPLSVTSQYDLAKSQFQAVQGAASAGDYNSAQQLQTYSQAFLTASRAVNGSGAGYANDFTKVLDAIQAVAAAPSDALTNSALLAATQTQTATLSGKFDELKTELIAVRRELQQQARAA